MAWVAGLGPTRARWGSTALRPRRLARVTEPLRLAAHVLPTCARIAVDHGAIRAGTRTGIAFSATIYVSLAIVQLSIIAVTFSAASTRASCKCVVTHVGSTA